MSLGEFIPSSNTILMLHLNGNSTDGSSNGLNGTDTSITYSKIYGKFNEGATFNGSTSRIMIPSQDLFRTNTWTFSCILVNKGTLPATASYIFARNKNADLYARLGIGFQKATGKLFVCANQGTNEWERKDVYSFNDLANGDMITITSKWPTLKTYKNGVLVNTSTFTTRDFLTVDANAQIAIGRAGAYSNYYFNGALDEIIFENIDWSAIQVQKYYTNTIGRFAII